MTIKTIIFATCAFRRRSERCACGTTGLFRFSKDTLIFIFNFNVFKNAPKFYSIFSFF